MAPLPERLLPRRAGRSATGLPTIPRMPQEPQQLRDAELDLTIERLKEALRASGANDGDGTAGYLQARRELDRLWAVSAERPFLYRTGFWGRLRGLVLVPPKAVLRRLMRWYVEPLATDQRQFNAGVLRLADELGAELARLDKRLELLEQGNREAESDEPRSAG
jgi:hypothetical protein